MEQMEINYVREITRSISFLVTVIILQRISIFYKNTEQKKATACVSRITTIYVPGTLDGHI